MQNIKFKQVSAAINSNESKISVTSVFCKHLNQINSLQNIQGVGYGFSTNTENLFLHYLIQIQIVIQIVPTLLNNVFYLLPVFPPVSGVQVGGNCVRRTVWIRLVQQRLQAVTFYINENDSTTNKFLKFEKKSYKIVYCEKKLFYQYFVFFK